jgi:phospholipid/cholesterol/gamma-HCH transport system permease protein
MINLVAEIGRITLNIAFSLGRGALFLIHTIKTLLTKRLKVFKTLTQMERIGVNSFVIVVLTGTFAGAVLALQSYIGLQRFGTEKLIGPLVALAMTRELGPVLAGLMVTGRAGSAIAAEIGTMRITEQIDALRTLCIDVDQYLVVPRLVAGTIIMPFLTIFCMICGIVGGYVICVFTLGLNGDEYITEIQKYLELSDITGGLIKSSFFGLILSWIGSYKGFFANGGARGVGQATTQAVVVASIMILIANYFLAAVLFWE